MEKIIKTVIIVALILLLLFYVADKFKLHLPHLESTPKVSVVTKTISHVDTVYVKQFVHDTVHIASPTTIKIDTIYKKGKIVYMPVVHKIYADSASLKDSVTVAYRADVTGNLNSIMLDYKNHKSQRTIIKTDSVFVTKTIKNFPAGVFLGMDAGYNTITPKIEVIKNHNSFSAGYNIITKTPQVGYSRRLF